MRKFLLLFILAFAISCAPKRAFYNPKVEGWESNVPPPESELIKTVFLLGDAGKPAVDPLEPTFRILDSQLKAEDAKGKEWSLIYLGDNIYPRGLPDIDYATLQTFREIPQSATRFGKRKKGQRNHDSWKPRLGKNGQARLEVRVE